MKRPCMKTVWGTLLVAAACCIVSGCAVLLVGAGAAGGYAVSRDSVISHFDLPMSHVYRSSLEVAREMGQVTLEDSKHGIIQARIKEANVKITVKQLTPKTVQLRVKARAVMPRIEVAQEVYNKIAERLL